jgi:hypothetical protein
VAEEVGYVVGRVNGFGHPVVQREHGEAEVFDAEYDAVLGGEAKVDATLDAGDAWDGAVVKNVGRLGGPGRDSALTRGDEEAAFALEMVVGREQCKGALGGLIVEDVGRLDEIDFDGVDVGDLRGRRKRRRHGFVGFVGFVVGDLGGRRKRRRHGFVGFVVGDFGGRRKRRRHGFVGFVEGVLKRGETKVGKCGTALKNDRLHSSKSGKSSKLAMDLKGNNSKNRERVF